MFLLHDLCNLGGWSFVKKVPLVLLLYNVLQGSPKENRCDILPGPNPNKRRDALIPGETTERLIMLSSKLWNQP